MITNIVWAVLGGLAQLVNAWLGYKIAGTELSVRKRKLADICFLSCGLIGVLSIAIITYRAGAVERAHFATSMSNTYNSPAFLVLDHPLSFNLTYKNVGNGAASKVRALGWSSIQNDESIASEAAAIAEFEKFLASDLPNVSVESVQKDQAKFITAFGPRLTAENIQDVMTGRKVVYVVGDITFSDDFGSHTQHVCQRIEPFSAERNSEIWSDCHQHNSEGE